MGEPDIRDLELVLTRNGRAELVDYSPSSGGEEVVWASDTDEDFMEEFPEFLNESDVPHVLDYLVEHEVITDDEADVCEVSEESLTEAATVNGDDEDEDDDEE